MSATQLDAFSAESPGEFTRPRLEKSGPALWTAEKSALIDEYIHLFLVVTKHGVYVDLFAGPQRVEDTESWSVRRVLERRTVGNPSIRHFAVCDKDPGQAQRLRELGSRHPSFRVYPRRRERGNPHNPRGSRDRDEYGVLLSDRPAHLRVPLGHRENGRAAQIGGPQNRAVLLPRARLARSRPEQGEPGEAPGPGGAMETTVSSSAFDRIERANALCRRFRDELKYEHAMPFAIQERGANSRIMYYMIHASDHRRAAELMSQAYRTVRERRQTDGVQLLLL